MPTFDEVKTWFLARPAEPCTVSAFEAIRRFWPPAGQGTHPHGRWMHDTRPGTPNWRQAMLDRREGDTWDARYGNLDLLQDLGISDGPGLVEEPGWYEWQGWRADGTGHNGLVKVERAPGGAPVTYLLHNSTQGGPCWNKCPPGLQALQEHFNFVNVGTARLIGPQEAEAESGAPTPADDASVPREAESASGATLPAHRIEHLLHAARVAGIAQGAATMLSAITKEGPMPRKTQAVKPKTLKRLEEAGYPVERLQRVHDAIDEGEIEAPKLRPLQWLKGRVQLGELVTLVKVVIEVAADGRVDADELVAIGAAFVDLLDVD